MYSNRLSSAVTLTLYEPDWAIVVDSPEQDGQPVLYLVAETKSAKPGTEEVHLEDLRPD